MNLDELRQQLFQLLMSNQIDDDVYERRLNLLEQQAARQKAEEERLKHQIG